MKKNIRSVRVYRKLTTSSSWFNSTKEVPWVTLSGVWLKQAGFNSGDHLEIHVGEKELIIRHRN